VAEMNDGIVAGYDGSPGSEVALHWAASEAWARGTDLLVCMAWTPEYLAVLSNTSVYKVAEPRAEEILARGVQHAEPTLGSGRVRSVLAEGPAARVLTEHSRTAEMVVVGSRGHGRFAGMLLGSVSWHVADHGQGRIVVVREQARPANDGAGQIVVGADGSPSSEAAVTFAFEEAALRRVPLLTVCALADAPTSLGGARRMEEDFARSMVLREKEHPDVTVLRQVSAGSPRAALLAAAADAQLLVVGARGRGGFKGMRLGSVAHAVLEYAPCPVGVVHPSRPTRLP
jgi:nucleotide-binding universal stress UspA family protein